MADATKSNQGGRGRSRSRTENNFREKLGDKDIEVSEYKVDELRKMASEFGISGSHGMNKENLVDAINKARKNDK
jgi:hypothetical protein